MYADYAKIRDAAGLSDSAVAKKADISAATLSDWKNGKSQIKADKLSKIADALNVTIDALMGRPAPQVDDRVLAYYTALVRRPMLQEIVDRANQLSDDDLKLVLDMMRRLSA